MGLDCEFTVVEPEPYFKRKLWQWMTIEGTTPGHDEAGKISGNTLRAILESARGIKPDDTGEVAQAARKVGGWADFNGIRFIAQLGVKPPKDGYAAKNTILKVITPERQLWHKPPQGPLPDNDGAPKPSGGGSSGGAAAPAAAGKRNRPATMGRLMGEITKNEDAWLAKATEAAIAGARKSR